MTEKGQIEKHSLFLTSIAQSDKHSSALNPLVRSHMTPSRCMETKNCSSRMDGSFTGLTMERENKLYNNDNHRYYVNEAVSFCLTWRK
jgi:hypothetical protein